MFWVVRHLLLLLRHSEMIGLSRSFACHLISEGKEVIWELLDTTEYLHISSIQSICAYFPIQKESMYAMYGRNAYPLVPKTASSTHFPLNIYLLACTTYSVETYLVSRVICKYYQCTCSTCIDAYQVFNLIWVVFYSSLGNTFCDMLSFWVTWYQNFCLSSSLEKLNDFAFSVLKCHKNSTTVIWLALWAICSKPKITLGITCYITCYLIQFVSTCMFKYMNLQLFKNLLQSFQSLVYLHLTYRLLAPTDINIILQSVLKSRGKCIRIHGNETLTLDKR